MLDYDNTPHMIYDADDSLQLVKHETFKFELQLVKHEIFKFEILGRTKSKRRHKTVNGDWDLRVDLPISFPRFQLLDSQIPVAYQHYYHRSF